MWRSNKTRFLALSLALLLACASALSASHLPAHQSSDSHVEETCLALHTVGLDAADLDSGKGQAASPVTVWRCELAVFQPHIRSFIRPSTRAPPFFLKP